MAFTCEPAIIINAEHLQTPVYMPVKEVDGVMYFNLSKSDKRLERLFGNTDPGRKRVFPDTSIVEDISAFINKQFWNSLSDENQPDVSPNSKTPRMSKSMKAKALAIAEDPISIELPAVSDLQPFSLRALMTQPTLRHCWIELCPSVLAYLHRLVRIQLDGDSCHRKRPKHDNRFDNDGVAGISKDYASNRIRVSFVEDGRSKNKYFQIIDSEDQAREDAKSFIRDHQSA